MSRVSTQLPRSLRSLQTPGPPNPKRVKTMHQTTTSNAVVRSQVELLRIDISICEVGVYGKVGDEVRSKVKLHVESARVKGGQARRETGASRIGGEWLKPV